jgi:hypothetical protein
MGVLMATLEELEARIAELERGAAVAPLAAAPPVTIGELTNVPAPGSPIQSAWAQSATNRILHRFATIAARDAGFTSPAEGTQCIVTATKRRYISRGGAWSIDGWYAQAGRVGGQWSIGGAGQLIPNGALTAITWGVEAADPDNMLNIPNANLTIPTGFDGRYLVKVNLAYAAATLNANMVRMLFTGESYSAPGPATVVGEQTLTIERGMAAGDSFSVQTYHNSGSSVNVQGILAVTMIGI